MNVRRRAHGRDELHNAGMLVLGSSCRRNASRSRGGRRRVRDISNRASFDLLCILFVPLIDSHIAVASGSGGIGEWHEPLEEVEAQSDPATLKKYVLSLRPVVRTSIEMKARNSGRGGNGEQFESDQSQKFIMLLAALST